MCETVVLSNTALLVTFSVLLTVVLTLTCSESDVIIKAALGQAIIIIVIIVYYATKAANMHTQLHVQEHNKKIKNKTLKKD